MQEKIKCAIKTSVGCTCKCGSIDISLTPPHISPSIDLKCLEVCLPSEYEKCIKRHQISKGVEK